MQRSVGREDIGPVVRRTVYSSKSGDETARLFDQKGARKRVPRTHIGFKKSIESPTSHVGKRQCRRPKGPHCAHHPEERT